MYVEARRRIPKVENPGTDLPLPETVSVAVWSCCLDLSALPLRANRSYEGESRRSWRIPLRKLPLTGRLMTDLTMI